MLMQNLGGQTKSIMVFSELAYWDIPLYADNMHLKANRIDATIVDKENKKVSVIEMSCPWIENREEKDAEKTTKYGPLRWELEQR